LGSSSSPSSGVDGVGLFAALAPSGELEACLFDGVVTMTDSTYDSVGLGVDADVSNIFSYSFCPIYHFFYVPRTG
jgi:hypothetical protein